MGKKRKFLSDVKPVHPHNREHHESGALLPSFFSKHKKWMVLSLTVLLLLVPIILAVWFRSYTYSLPAADNWAEQTVMSNVRASIETQVAQNYPNLPAQNRQTLVDEQYAKIMEDPTIQQQISQQVTSTAAYFKSQLQDEKGHTYLPDIDTYYHLRRIEMVLKNGHPGDELRDGEPYDTHMLAPIGSPTVRDFYSWFEANLYRITHVFNPQTTPLYVFFWAPLLFAALCVIPAFFIGRREGLIAAFFAAMLIAVHPSVIGRTGAGFADTDILVFFFSLLVAWFFIEAFETPEGRWIRRSVWLVLLGMGFLVFAAFWNWWYLFDIFLIVILAHIIYEIFKRFLNSFSLKAIVASKEIRWAGVMLLGFIVVAGMFVSISTSFSSFIRGPMSVIAKTGNFKDAVAVGSIWPNVSTTVAELNEPDLLGIVNSVGGKFFFLLGLMGMLFTMVPKDGLRWKDWALLGVGLCVFLFLISSKGMALPIFWFLIVMALPVLLGVILLLNDDRNIDVKYAIFLVAWLAASIFTMTKGVRFILLLVPPFAIAAAIAIGAIYLLLKAWLVESLSFSRYWVIPVLFIVLCLPLVPIAVQGRATGMQGVPNVNDAWWNSLTLIKEQSAPDAILNSWWDFGHWFKYIADRGVTFDGASQGSPMAHWIGRALITSDEKETLAILRMADCGSDRGTDELQQRLPGNDQYEAIMLTKQIIMMRHADAKALLLAKGLNVQDVDYVLNHTHCDPPEDYFITSGDMVGKAGVWGHFGSWDFARADAYEKFRVLPRAEAVPAMAAKYSWTEDDARNMYDEMRTLLNQPAVNAWISPWPGYPSSRWSGCTPMENGTLLLCQVNIQLNQQNGMTTVLEGIVVNLSQPNESFLAIGSYNAQGQKAGQSLDYHPSGLILAHNGTFTRYNFTSNLFGQSFVVDLDAKTAMMVDPLHADSMFMRLFFMDGKGTTAFQKFSDQTDFMGTRIIVWKVDWSKLEALGLE